MAGGPDFHEVLRELAQQQSALSQQQAALVQLQSESLRFQRLLIERAMGEAQPEFQQPVIITPSSDKAAEEPASELPLGGEGVPIAVVQDQPTVSPESPSEDSLRPATRPSESRPGSKR